APLQTACTREDGVVEDDHFIALPHPKTGHNQQYLFRENDREIFEIVKFNESPRSWFVDNSVIQDGSLHFATRIDPLFMVLPFLKNTSTKFMTLDHILQDSNNEHLAKLSHCITNEDLALVTEVKGEDDLVALKLNHDKVISWLEKKVHQTKDQLEQDNICTSGAQSSTFVRSSKSRGNTQDDYLRYAYGLVSDYISDYWSQKLKDCLGITDEILESSGEEPACKKVKLDESLVGQPDEDYSKFATKTKKTDQHNVKLTAAQKSLAKVNTKGMKSISSFFGAPKKSKK
ncbi:ribonuclease H2 subunit B-like, partial [Paramuricea clavata]